jgi:hypothetical protein
MANLYARKTLLKNASDPSDVQVVYETYEQQEDGSFALKVAAELVVGDVTIGKVDQGEAGAEAWLVQEGTDITSPTAMPAGGAGLRGWLSAIWTKLNASLAVTGTFWQTTQPASDAGPAQAVTRTPFTSNDASVTPVDLTTAPGASLKAVAMDIIVSVVTACTVNIITEDGTGFGLHMGANSTVQLTPRGYVKGATNNKKLQITTSVASVVSGVCNWFAEA